MKKHTIYLATDSNRSRIAVDYCENITQRQMELSETHRLFSFGRTPVSRIVYVEEFLTYDEAQQRRSELTTYTHMMKERIIRRKNPNWLSIVVTPKSRLKKTVAYA